MSTTLTGYLTPATDLLAVEIENHRDGYHDGRETAEQRACPLNAEVVEHLITKEREPGAKHGSEQRVGRDAGCCEHQVCVDQVVEALQEDA